MKFERGNLHPRHLLVGVPVVAVWAVLSAAAVFALVQEPAADFTPVDSSAETESGGLVPGPSEPSDPSGLLSLSEAELPTELPEIGTYARAVVRPDGAVDVVEWVRTATATTTLTLSLPSGSPASGAAREVVLMNAGGPASGPSEMTSAASYDFAQPATVFVARYVLTGVARLSPMSETRALVQPVALSLTAGSSGGEPVGGPRLLSVEASDVLALACTDPVEESALTPCGAPNEEGWEVELDSTRWSDLVAAQVDLG